MIFKGNICFRLFLIFWADPSGVFVVEGVDILEDLEQKTKENDFLIGGQSVCDMRRFRG